MNKFLQLLLFTLLPYMGKAQHLQIYSLYMFNGLVLNPAYAGTNGALTAMAHFRDQWVNFSSGSPQTYTLTIDSPLRNKKINLGAVLSYDKYGITTRTDYAQSFAYRMNISNSGHLSLGFQAGLSYIYNNWTSLSGVSDDEAFVSAKKNTIAPKIGLGIFYNHNRFYAGISIPQIIFYNKKDSLNNPTFYTTSLYYATTGYAFPISSELIFTPSLLAKYIESSPFQVDINSTLTYKSFLTGGFSFRTGSAIILLAEFKIDQLKIGYAYDYYTNNLKNFSNGSHEIMIKYEFKYGIRVMDPRNFRN